jgi:hypothetical protein
MAACSRSSSKNRGKKKLNPVLNRIFTMDSYAKLHHGLICSVFGVPGTLLKYVVHLSKRKN